jgi:hypothetical protein
MRDKTQTESFIRSVPLPTHGGRYAVIPHSFIIDKVRDELNKNNFIVKHELYKASGNGEEVRGFVHIENTLDPEMGMVLTWTNSYNKQVKFSCAVGGYMYDNQCAFVTYDKEAEGWIRKHLGTALPEAEKTIIKMISNASNHFNKIIDTKQKMCNVQFTDDMYGCLMGKIYFQHEYMKSEQVNIVKSERKKPTFDYTYKGTAWEFFKHVAFAMIDASPKEWLSKMQQVHYTILNELDLINPVKKNDIDKIEIHIESDEEYEERISKIISKLKDKNGEKIFPDDEYVSETFYHEGNPFTLLQRETLKDYVDEIIEEHNEEIKESLPIGEEEYQSLNIEETIEEPELMLIEDEVINDLVDLQESVLAEQDLKEELIEDSMEELIEDDTEPTSPISELEYKPILLNPFNLGEVVMVTALNKEGTITGVENNRYLVELENNSVVCMNPLMLSKKEIIKTEEINSDNIIDEKIKEKMRNLYSKTKAYTTEKLDNNTIAVTIILTGETFVINI